MAPKTPKPPRYCACGRQLGPLQTGDLCERCQAQFRRVSARERRAAKVEEPAAPPRLRLVPPLPGRE